MDMPDRTLPALQADPLRRLVDSVLAGDDVTLFIRSDDGRDLLEAAAGCLVAMRCRVLRATGAASDGLSLPALLEQAVGQPAPGAQNDEFLRRSFQAFTTLDATCDRIVLLVSDANALRPTALRYIQLACRAGTSLQLVLAGKRGFLDLLDHPEFAHLRERLATGPIITPVPPRPAFGAASQRPRAIQGLFDAEEATRVGQTQHSSPQFDRPMLSSLANSPHRRRFAALTGISFGIAACIALAIWAGESDPPAIPRQQAMLVFEPPKAPEVQPLVIPDAPRQPPDSGPASSGVASAPSSAPPPSVEAAAPSSGQAPVAAPPISGPPVLASPAPAEDASALTAPLPAAPSAMLPPTPTKNVGRKNPQPLSRFATARAPTLNAGSVAAWEDPYPPPPRDWRPTAPAQMATELPDQPKSYIGTYATDANGIRTFRPSR